MLRANKPSPSQLCLSDFCYWSIFVFCLLLQPRVGHELDVSASLCWNHRSGSFVLLDVQTALVEVPEPFTPQSFIFFFFKFILQISPTHPNPEERLHWLK